MSSRAKLRFGRYKGCLWLEVPKDYLEWIERTFEKRTVDWYAAVAELQRREDEAAGIPTRLPAVPLKPKAKKRKKRKKPRGAPREAPPVTGATWSPPVPVALPQHERDRLFEEIVDTSQGTVHNVERWAHVKPSLPSKGKSGLHPSKVWGDYEDYCSLENDLTDVLRRND